MSIRKLATLVTGFMLLLPATGPASERLIRVGVLEFGTVNWELDVINHHQLDQKAGFSLEITRLGSKNATAVALQSGAVDMIVTDYIWVARQRTRGSELVFYPHSNALGAVMVNPRANIASLSDLAGRELGIAGGPVDKSWLLLQAYHRQQGGDNLADILEPRFAAPPLLNKLVERGDLPAALNFWHYSARLSAQGMQQLLSMREVLESLGIERRVAMIGWVFDENWARKNLSLVNAFLDAMRDAKRLLNDSDDEWKRLAPMVRSENEPMLNALRDAYREGIPSSFNEQDRAAAINLYSILAELGGQRLVGNAREIPAGLFWRERDF
jgi:NitT/TauT family transport system substrate-binding protein